MKLTMTINCDHDHEIDHDLNCDPDHEIDHDHKLWPWPWHSWFTTHSILRSVVCPTFGADGSPKYAPSQVQKCSSTVGHSKNLVTVLSNHFAPKFFWKWEITQTCVRRFYQQLTPLCNMLRSFCGLCCSNGSQSSGNDVYSDLFPIMFCISNPPTHVLWKSFQVTAFHELHTCADSWAEKISESNWGEVKSTSEC